MKDLLLVIDMQNAYLTEGPWACTDTLGAAQNIKMLIDHGICDDVIFTMFLAKEDAKGVWADYNHKYRKINDDLWANDMIEELKPYASLYPVYSKGVYSSLEIPEVLKASTEANRVIITGVVAECCVLSTVLALMDAGIYMIYLTDAVSGLTAEKEKATELILSGLSPLHLTMMTTKEYIQSLESDTVV